MYKDVQYYEPYSMCAFTSLAIADLIFALLPHGEHRLTRYHAIRTWRNDRDLNMIGRELNMNDRDLNMNHWELNMNDRKMNINVRKMNMNDQDLKMNDRELNMNNRDMDMNKKEMKMNENYEMNFATFKQP